MKKPSAAFHINPKAATEKWLGIGDSMDAVVRNEIKTRNEVREHFIALYLARTGADIRETVICEGPHPTKPNVTVFWCEQRS